MPGAAFLVGDRVTLTTVESDDVAFLRDGVNHPEVRALVGQPFPTNLDQEHSYWEDVTERSDAVQVLITVSREAAETDAEGSDDADDRVPVGVVELDPVDRETGVADLGVWIHPAHHRQGYASEAIELVVGYAFDELRMHKVTANAYARNEASRRMLASLGFVEEGVGREDAFLDGAYHDTHYFGVLDAEWRERDAE
ncbi:GNAT family N-acetyltransferase [Salinirubrum litoreum]|uniref:GNAT family N-acetyltransferase n=1 Tax=Salinirubrum litoreum TaxID=1126234 RepID=A0ABD5REH1_9EURY|nr:GNAT family protein [Salinirubrum litoreum]